MSAQVTAMGIRDGDPAVLAALVERRGAAVLAYCERYCAPSLALDAAADAFARFRATVMAAARPGDLDPEAALIGATRHAAAARSPRPPAEAAGGLSRVFGGRGSTRRLPEVPDLLVSRAEGTLTPEDATALDELLTGSPVARSIASRFENAEEAYRTAPRRDLPAPIVDQIVASMTSLAAPPPPAVPITDGPAPRFFRDDTDSFEPEPAEPFAPEPPTRDPFAIPVPEGLFTPTAHADDAPEAEALEDDAPPLADEPEVVDAPPLTDPADQDEPEVLDADPLDEPAAADEPVVAEDAPLDDLAEADEPEVAETGAEDVVVDEPEVVDAVPLAEDEEPDVAETGAEDVVVDEPDAVEADEPDLRGDTVEAPVLVDEAVPDSAEIAAARGEPSETVEWSVPEAEEGPEVEQEIAAARVGEEDAAHLQTASGAVAEEDVHVDAPATAPPAPHQHRHVIGRAALAPAAAVVAIAAIGAMVASGVFGGNDPSPPVDTGIVPERALQAVPEGEAATVVDDLREAAADARRRRLADLRQALAARPLEPITPADPETTTTPATGETDTETGAGTTTGTP